MLQAIKLTAFAVLSNSHIILNSQYCVVLQYRNIATVLLLVLLSLLNVLHCLLQGIRKTHTDFQYEPSMNMRGFRALHGWSAFGNGTDSEDCLGHGTHTAATIGSLTYGVAKNVTLWVCTLCFSIMRELSAIGAATLQHARSKFAGSKFAACRQQMFTGQ